MHKNILIIFNYDKVFLDTHNLFDFNTYTITSNCDGLLKISIKADKDSKIFYRINKSDYINPTTVEGISHFTYNVKAGDQIDINKDRGQIIEGKIKIIPLIDLKHSDSKSKIEKIGEVVNIKESGFYSVYTFNGRLNFKKIDDIDEPDI